MNFAGIESAGWIYQQDYLTFLAIVGWITAALIAWSNAVAVGETRAMPWRWFGFFALFCAVDGILGLSKMVSPGWWPSDIDAIFRLAAWGCLLEFARRVAASLGWVRLSPVLPAAISTLGLGLAFFFPRTSPYPQIVVAVMAGVAAGIVLMATVAKGTRSLLLVGVALVLLGPLEIFRSRQGVEIERLFGLFVSGEGFVVALCGCVLAWLASGGIWLHDVIERQALLNDEHPHRLSSLPVFVLPFVILGALAAGYFLVNRSSDQARAGVEESYRSRVRTAALAIDTSILPSGGAVPMPEVSARVMQQLYAIRAAAEDLRRVYLWQSQEGRAVVVANWIVGHVASGEEPAVVRIGGGGLPSSGAAFVTAPLGIRTAPVVLASAPVVDYINGRQLAWLGADIAADRWLQAQASARMQTTALVGLFVSIIVFFLAYQILRENESDLLVAKERAEAADRAKDEFLAVMSHEIRTPMQSVLGYGELLARTKLSENQGNYLDAIRSQGRTLLRIVQDILDFSILRKSTYTLKCETVYLHRLVQTAFETIQPLAARRELRTVLTVADEVPEVVLGDGVRIEQVLLNLMGNAVKFTDVGSVSLSVSLEGITKQRGLPTNHVRFVIEDTGTGIKRKDIRRLFQPFTRLSEAESTPREGAGLGLAIVKRICELMGGQINLESEWGKGTRFTVRLPLPSVETSPADGELGSSIASGLPDLGPEKLGDVLPLRILVGEDNPYIRLLMVEYLRFIGYEPTAVENGAEVAKRWREHDLVIMDLRMPGMDGVTAATRIRAESNNPTEPWIVGVSATLAEAEIARAMEAGMNDFLGKPFFVQSLVEAIQASPLHAKRRSPAPAAEPELEVLEGESDEEVGEDIVPPPQGTPEPLPVTMSWMPDLASDGDNEVVRQAVAEIPDLLAEIENGLKTGDTEQAADRAHYLKNTILALRIDPMIGPCRAVYEKAVHKEIPVALEMLVGLRDAFHAWDAERHTRVGRQERTPRSGAETE